MGEPQFLEAVDLGLNAGLEEGLRYEAAAFGLTFLTAYSMMFGKARIAAGQSVLITGIGGGVVVEEPGGCVPVACPGGGGSVEDPGG